MDEPEPDAPGRVDGASPGALVVIGTPIGNVADLSPRAAEALGRCGAIACEDTRRTGGLLRRMGIVPPPLLVANEHTEVARIAEIVDRVAAGERVGLVSDAGMPTVSDPGSAVIAAVAAAGHRVEVVPGVTAAMTALAVSGFRADRFVFEGFLPRKGSARTERLASVAAEQRTVVLYEAPHRIRRTLDDLATTCGADRRAVVARELTKLYEEVLRGTLADLIGHFARVEPRGELVVVLDGAVTAEGPVPDAILLEALQEELGRGLSKRDAAATVAAATGTPKRRVYALSTTIGSGEGDADDDPDPDGDRSGTVAG